MFTAVLIVAGLTTRVACSVVIMAAAWVVFAPVTAQPAGPGATQVLPEGPFPPVGNRLGQQLSIEAGTGRVMNITRAATTVVAAERFARQARPASSSSVSRRPALRQI